MDRKHRKEVAATLISLALAIPLLLFGIGSVFRNDASAQVSTPGLPIVPLGYCQLTLAGATKFSSCSGGLPAGATMVYLSVETAAIRYRDDGVAPSATVGMPVAIGGSLFYAGTLSAMQMIPQTGSPVVDILFYR